MRGGITTGCFRCLRERDVHGGDFVGFLRDGHAREAGRIHRAYDFGNGARLEPGPWMLCRVRRTQPIQLAMNIEFFRPSWIPLADDALKRAALRARDVAI